MFEVTSKAMGEAAARVIDKYELVRLLGEGGMGAVYEARHTLVGHRYALKVLRAELARDDKVIKRMMREARAAAEIGHPNIVQTHDFGTLPDGTCYIAMELLEGESLDALMARHGQMEAEITVAIIMQVLSALVSAHQKGIIHRDLKPENVFIARLAVGGTAVKLLDFGISKFRLTDKDTLRLTHTGAVMGTPYYMSPEQAGGAKDVDERTDLWAVGVILYQMLTGQFPFTGDNYNQLILKIVTKPFVAPRRHNPSIPERLEAVIVRALQKDMSHRFQRATQMIEALLPFYDRGEAEAGRFLLREALLRQPLTRSAERPVVAPYGQTGPPFGKDSDPGTDRTLVPEEAALLGSGTGPEPLSDSGELSGVDPGLPGGTGTRLYDSGENLQGASPTSRGSWARKDMGASDGPHADPSTAAKTPAEPATQQEQALRDSDGGFGRTATRASGRVVRLDMDELRDSSPPSGRPALSVTPSPSFPVTPTSSPGLAPASDPNLAAAPSIHGKTNRLPVLTFLLALVAVGALVALVIILVGRGKAPSPSPADVSSSSSVSESSAYAEDPSVAPGNGSLVILKALATQPMGSEGAVDPSRPITVTLSGLPDKATIRLNGLIAENPLRVLPTGERYMLEISAPGYETVKTEFLAVATLRSLPVAMVELPDKRGRRRTARTEADPSRARPSHMESWGDPFSGIDTRPMSRPRHSEPPPVMSRLTESPPPPPPMRPTKTTDGVYGNPYGD